MEKFSVCDFITQVVNKLFVYTDLQQWNKLQNEVFTEQVVFDMSSLGGDQSNTTAKKICETWEEEFIGIDSVNHLAGNYLIEISGEEATVFAYATATHYKKLAKNGNTREFVGTYNLHLINKEDGWRIDQFKYNLKYSNGNVNFT
ncbi:MAG: nuclear transport factor 2 family protein [Ferruginibacter sp.]